MKLVPRKPKRKSIRHYTPVTPDVDRKALHALFQRISANAPSNALLKRIAKKLRTTNTNRYCVKLGELVSNILSHENNSKSNNNNGDNAAIKELSKYINKIDPTLFAQKTMVNAKMHDNFYEAKKLSNRSYKPNLYEIKDSLSDELVADLKKAQKPKCYLNSDALLGKEFDRVFLVVGKVLGDDEVVVLPKIKLICLKISESAKKQIEMFGGEVMTLDTLFSNDLSKVSMIEGDNTKRRVVRYYGSPGGTGKRGLEKVLCPKKNVLARPS